MSSWKLKYEVKIRENSIERLEAKAEKFLRMQSKKLEGRKCKRTEKIGKSTKGIQQPLKKRAQKGKLKWKVGNSQKKI